MWRYIVLVLTAFFCGFTRTFLNVHPTQDWRIPIALGLAVFLVVRGVFMHAAAQLGKSERVEKRRRHKAAKTSQQHKSSDVPTWLDLLVARVKSQTKSSQGNLDFIESVAERSDLSEEKSVAQAAPKTAIKTRTKISANATEKVGVLLAHEREQNDDLPEMDSHFSLCGSEIERLIDERIQAKAEAFRGWMIAGPETLPADVIHFAKDVIRRLPNGFSARLLVTDVDPIRVSALMEAIELSWREKLVFAPLDPGAPEYPFRHRFDLVHSGRLLIEQDALARESLIRRLGGVMADDGCLVVDASLGSYLDPALWERVTLGVFRKTIEARVSPKTGFEISADF